MSVLLNPVTWLLAIALVMVCSAKRHEWPLRTLASARVLTTWVIGWQPTLAAIRDGHLSVVIGAMAIAGWSFLRARRDGGAGSFIGAATALKFYPGLLLFAAPRSRRFVIAAVVTVLLAVAVSVLAFGAEQWGAYRQAVNDVGLGHARSSLNLSLVARLNQVLPPTVAFVVWAAGGALLVALTVWRSRAQAEAGGIDLSFARVACLAIVLSPAAWAHYLFLAAQPLAVLLRSAIAGHRVGLAAAAVGLALLLGLPVAERSGMWPSVETGGPLNAIFSPTTVLLALWALLMIETPDRRAGTTA